MWHTVQNILHFAFCGSLQIPLDLSESEPEQHSLFLFVTMKLSFLWIKMPCSAISLPATTFASHAALQGTVCSHTIGKANGCFPFQVLAFLDFASTQMVPTWLFKSTHTPHFFHTRLPGRTVGCYPDSQLTSTTMPGRVLLPSSDSSCNDPPS